MLTKDEETLNSREAATLMGFESTGRFIEKVKKGAIPGCKIGRWRFIKSDLLACIRNNYVQKDDSIAGESNIWQLARKRAAHTGIQDSRSAASECKNRLNALLEAKRKNTKTSAEMKSGSM